MIVDVLFVLAVLGMLVARSHSAVVLQFVALYVNVLFMMVWAVLGILVVLVSCSWVRFCFVYLVESRPVGCAQDLMKPAEGNKGETLNTVKFVNFLAVPVHIYNMPKYLDFFACRMACDTLNVRLVHMGCEMLGM